jgi:3-methylfumaryl-CoA hydratase
VTSVSYGDWSASPEDRVDSVTPAMAARLHLLLDAPGPAPSAGDALPPLWHWLAFLPDVAQALIGPDGHPKKGGFLPPVELPRRMFVGARYQFEGKLHVGESLTRHGEVTAITVKEGSSGTLVFVTVAYRTSGASGVVLEEQDIVYREAATAKVPEPSGEADEQPTWDFEFSLDPTPPLLLRFSALTYNAHRIHYDRQWATEEEGYPGLVVHGPLQAVALAEVLRRSQPSLDLATFSFKSSRPAFDGHPLWFKGRVEGLDAHLGAYNHLGQLTTQGSGHFA